MSPMGSGVSSTGHDTRIPGKTDLFRQSLEAALARPGVREAMKVYSGWQEKDRGLDVYRSATKKPERITTTNSSNVC